MNPAQIDLTKDAFGLIDAFTRDLASFVSGLTGIASNVQQRESLGKMPRLRIRYLNHQSGAAQTLTITEDCYYLGCAQLYNAGTVTVTVDSSLQSAVVAAPDRELTGLVAIGSTQDSTLGKIRTFMAKDTKLTVSTNTGPLVTGHLFELIEP